MSQTKSARMQPFTETGKKVYTEAGPKVGPLVLVLDIEDEAFVQGVKLASIHTLRWFYNRFSEKLSEDDWVVIHDRMDDVEKL